MNNYVKPTVEKEEASRDKGMFINDIVIEPTLTMQIAPTLIHISAYESVVVTA